MFNICLNTRIEWFASNGLPLTRVKKMQYRALIIQKCRNQQY